MKLRCARDVLEKDQAWGTVVSAPSLSGGRGTIEVEAEIAAAADAASADEGAILSCRLCTFSNKLTATKCQMCGTDLLVDP